jgi:hypothetical protein
LWQNNMATFSFTLPNGQPFEVKGPSGLSLEQAKAIFDKQAATGSLVGLKPGMVLSAATQAAQGLKSAQALVNQAQSSINGALGSIPGAAGVVGSINSALGAAGGAINGSLSGVSAGLTGAVGTAVSATGAASIITGGAATAVNTINNIIATVPLTNEITITDFAKQIPAVTSIGPLSLPDVTGVLAQAKKLVDQAGSIVTDAKGLGEFGLSPAQLEAAGILKPGMAKFVADGASTVTDLLKSPKAFTSKDGIKSAQDLLGNLVKQGLIQQDLMKKGLDALKAFGVPADLMSAAGAAGSILNAAKDPAAAAAFLKKLPGIGQDLADTFTKNIRDAAFPPGLVPKIPPLFKAETVPVPTANTVNRDTVNAAVTRVLGNPKVPEPNYGPPERPPGLDAEVTEALTKASEAITKGVAETNQAIIRLTANVASLESRQTITAQEWEVINNERVQVGAKYNTTILPVRRSFNSLLDSTIKSIQQEFAAINKQLGKEIQELITNAIALKTRVNELAKKIQDGGGE